ncbi:MAG: hypothetical protein HOD37_20485 [Bacteroidetes bacterium]|nr:hypothetical protein [Bacteroidota bacterium]
MKTIRALSLVFLLAILATPSCQEFKLNPDDLVINLELDLIKTNINLRFYDAASKQMIGANDDLKISVTIHGQDSLYIIDPSGTQFEVYNTGGGFLGLALDPFSAIPTEDDPIIFNIVANLDGYLNTSKTLVIGREGIHEVGLEMVNLTHTPDGVEIGLLDDAGTANSGILDNNIFVYTQSGNASFLVPQGTNLMDKSGQALSGKLNASLVHFDPSVPGVLQAFPGGLDVTIINEDGDFEEVFFVSAAFMDIKITDANNHTVESFEQGVMELDIDIDPNIINPETGQHAQAGDEISIWSYDEDSGIWKFEGKKTIYPTPEGLGIKAEIPHLSSWNLAWTGANNHAGWKKIEFLSPSASYDSNDFSFAVTVVMDPSNSLSLSEASWSQSYVMTGSPDGNNELFMKNFPSEPLIISFTNLDVCGVSLWETPSDIAVNLSTYSGDYSLTLTPSSNQSTRTVNVIIHCLDTGQDITPTQTLMGRYREKGTSCWIIKSFTNGTTTIGGLEDNTVYEIQAWYNNSWVPASPYEKNTGTGSTVLFEPAINCI